MSELKLAFELEFEDLYSRAGLEKLDASFVNELKESNVELHNQFVTYRSNFIEGVEVDVKDEANFLIELAPYIEDFVSTLFGISAEVADLQKQHNDLAEIFRCKRIVVQRRGPKGVKGLEVDEIDGDALRTELESLFGESFSEKVYADNAVKWIDYETSKDIEGFEEQAALVSKYAGWALTSEAGRAYHKNDLLFQKPNKLDFEALVPIETESVDGVSVKRLSKSHALREREGFSLTDNGFSLAEAVDQANYCIYCHNQGKDSCSTGLREKKPDENGKTPFKVSPTRVKQAGCPLEERISEMNQVKSNGFTIGALAIVTVDNPMCAATGHRICNDCMKSCVYQKQDPVNIPAIETRTLTDTLDLPYGFEIYSLLTRWNPSNLKRPIPKKESGYKVLVAGLGPAGFSLAHHLLNDGHLVVGIDGLKIEPLPKELNGVDSNGAKTAFLPIKNIQQEVYEDLDERVLAGFGGVAEYGITVRWNKNFLKVIRLLLERREHFALFGGIRMGSTITYDQVFELGFDHLSLCLGAGKPTIVSMPNALARGVRTASDFLMSLQLTGAGKKNSIANLMVRLPVVVIGGGLTGIDAATEALAYYVVQVDKFKLRHDILVSERGEDAVRAAWNEEETIVAEEFLGHAAEIQEERANAEKENRDANIIGLMQKWGGATLAYRSRLQDAPSYRLNHEEVEKAMEEGITLSENVTPKSVRLDKYGAVKGLRVRFPVTNTEGDGLIDFHETTLPARTIFMAAGTNPNTVLGREDAKNFPMDKDNWYFKAVDLDGNDVIPEKGNSKPEEINVLMSKNENDKFVSFFGDLHPTYVGNVVKALGSTKQGYPLVTSSLGKANTVSELPASDFITSIRDQFVATVHEVIRLTPTILEVVLHAPLAARNFEPGQFYRLQNFESLALRAEDGTTLAMEGLALTGAWQDKEKGLISVIILEMGGSSDLCTHLKKDEQVVLMGPTGTPTEITKNEKVMLIGGGLGNAVLFSIGKAFKDAGCQVLYFAGYKEMKDRYKIEEIEKASDIIIWCCDAGTFEPERPQDKTFHGNIIQGIEAYAKGELGETPIRTEDCDRMITIGSDRMMAAIKNSRFNILKKYLKEDHVAYGSINSPMQCMMKEICAQCLQLHVDPITGERHFVYSCFNQDQILDSVDFPHLNERLKQNTIHEKLTKMWIDRSLKSIGLRE
ncbi:MAG: pyridine nucleotide-disulfide oxidoreductase [Flavobacteriales bacterium]|nr:pyridine nucleotide-disulfide oxidoreductase [Flavobacteriales bacterium]